jgi:phosphoglycolate phosphatase-like HAD superfamily hydrolase|tara:strand:- start:5523 stop:5969 length:447 start_codon:yes stop_codon:yes gene_type:complete
MTTVVIDLDGTLCNCVHRQHHAEQGQWDEFHSKLLDDPVYPDVAWFVAMLPMDYEVIALTGRDIAFKDDTWAWLERNKLSLAIDHLMMRPKMDFTPDHILKPQLLEGHIGSKEAVLAEVPIVLDDRDKVVEAWRNYGLPCWQVRPGGY